MGLQTVSGFLLHPSQSELVPDTDSSLCRRREVREKNWAGEFLKVNKTSAVNQRNTLLLMYLEQIGKNSNKKQDIDIVLNSMKNSK